MRRRLLVSTVGVTVAVLLLLVFPILVVLRNTAQEEEQRQLEASADRAMDVLEPLIDAGTDPPESLLLSLAPADAALTLVRFDRPDLSVGPSFEGSTVSALSRTIEGSTVRLTSASRGLPERIGNDIVSLGLLVLVGVASAAAISIVQSRRLARPFEQMAAAAERIGNGDFSVAIPTHSGLDELDDIGKALAASTTRLGQMFAAERSFTGDATHQLRTGLTGISLRLEMLAMNSDPSVREEAAAALAQTDQLNGTIDELLELARKGRAEHREVFDLEGLVRAHVNDWQASFNLRGRTISLRTHRSHVVATPGFAGQVIDLLLSNSLEHGAGSTVLHLGPHSVEISDDGPGIAPEALDRLFIGPTDPGAAHGRGLPLARRLAEADGGTLDLLDPAQALFRYDLLPADTATDTGE